MRITTIELDISELLFLLTHDNLQREADRQANMQPGGIVNDKPEEKPAEAGEEIKPASQVKKPSIPVVERPAYEPKPVSSKSKTNKDRRVDICKPGQSEWIECADYEAAASRIGCNFNTVLTAIRFKKDEVHGWKIRKHED